MHRYSPIILISLLSCISANAGSAYISNRTDSSIQVDYKICQSQTVMNDGTESCDEKTLSFEVPAHSYVLSPMQAVIPFVPGADHANIKAIKSRNAVFPDIAYSTTLHEQTSCAQSTTNLLSCRSPLSLGAPSGEGLDTVLIISDTGVPSVPMISRYLAGQLTVG